MPDPGEPVAARAKRHPRAVVWSTHLPGKAGLAKCRLCWFDLAPGEIVMRFATLISWLLTASMGAFMLRTWLARGGLRRERARGDGLPPQLIFSHAGLALSGLLVWSGYVATGTKAVAWTAVGLLMVTIALGLCTVTLWTPYPARRPGERRAPTPTDGSPVVVPDSPVGANSPDPPDSLI